MTASIQNTTDVCNLTLARIGYALRIGSLYDGSKAAKLFLSIYAQTRDAILRSGDWGFAERNAAMTLLKSAPLGGYIPPTYWNPAVNPPVPYLFEYAYPSDCLEVRAVKPVPLFLVNVDPTFYRWSVDNDSTFTPPQKVILCNIPSPAVLVYTGQVTDPSTWESDFVESLSAALGRRAAPHLVGLDVAKMEVGDETQETAAAEEIQG